MHEENISGVDLNLFLVLDALLETGSVTSAARRVGLSQPAASHALARLRVLLGDPLFVRSGRRLVPTARAEALRGPVAGALGMLRHAVAVPPAFDPATASRAFTLSTADLGQFVLLPALAKRLARRAPGVDVAVRPLDAGAIESRLAAGVLDLAIVPGEAPRGLRSEVLYRDAFTCVVRKGHPALARRWDLDAFCSGAHLFVAPRGSPESPVDEWLAARGRARRVALTVPHFLVAPHVVAVTDLIWTAPATIARAHARTLPLALRAPPVAMPTFAVRMAWHERHEGDAGHAWLRASLRAVAARVAGAAAALP